jgi:type II secretory pathway pseudopilin PulG
MKYQQNIILRKMKINIKSGFTILEIIITVTVSTLLVLIIVWIAFYLYKATNKLQEKSENIENMSEFLKIVSNDTLSPDIYPHHPVKDYSFSDESILFFSGGGKVQYVISDEGFKIIREYKKYNTPNNDDQTTDTNTATINIKEKIFKFIKKFKVDYYDRDDFINFDEQFPYYCEMIFTFNDNKEVRMKMRL